MNKKETTAAKNILVSNQIIEYTGLLCFTVSDTKEVNFLHFTVFFGFRNFCLTVVNTFHTQKTKLF